MDWVLFFNDVKVMLTTAQSLDEVQTRHHADVIISIYPPSQGGVMILRGGESLKSDVANKPYSQI
jgi:hypothetical protein